MSAIRQLAERRLQHPLISLFLDLDPTRFATGVARASEINSLLDQAHQLLHAHSLEHLDHQDRMALEQDIRRVGRYLTAELDPSGARGVAVYCSTRESLFEAVRLAHPVVSEVAIQLIPKLEPLLPAPEPACVCVTLVSRREARFFIPRGGSRVGEHHFEEQLHDEVHGQHRQGGWSEANYERSIEADVGAHLRRAAERLYQLWKAQRFDRLVLGGPHEVVARFTSELHADLAAVLDEAELAMHVTTTSPSEIDDALMPLRQRWRELAQWQALQRLLSTTDVRDGTSVGVRPTLAALGQRQVASLVLGPRADEEGAECPQCGQLYINENGSHCEADGTELRRLHSLRAAMIRSAVLQDAEVIVLDDYDDRPEIASFSGVGAILRY
ncbi:MAG TPA: Vms1/Ankzf1 family peptidyl-tRNA hydrolase [Solirubrobacteraceae bacterium]|nr:Vms1/Ankzf1 family peptidyl-tRNA hydrolase [Solirubrobacteraceae bacterium]